MYPLVVNPNRLFSNPATPFSLEAELLGGVWSERSSVYRLEGDEELRAFREGLSLG